MKKSWWLILGIFLVGASPFAQAKDCKEQIKDTRQMIHDHKDDYTMASRNKAEVHLVKAEANLVDLNPLPDMDCFAEVRKAKAELKKGKKAKKQKD